MQLPGNQSINPTITMMSHDCRTNFFCVDEPGPSCPCVRPLNTMTNYVTTPPPTESVLLWWRDGPTHPRRFGIPNGPSTIRAIPSKPADNSAGDGAVEDDEPLTHGAAAAAGTSASGSTSRRMFPRLRIWISTTPMHCTCIALPACPIRAVLFVSGSASRQDDDGASAVSVS